MPEGIQIGIHQSEEERQRRGKPIRGVSMKKGAKGRATGNEKGTM